MQNANFFSFHNLDTNPRVILLDRTVMDAGLLCLSSFHSWSEKSIGGQHDQDLTLGDVGWSAFSHFGASAPSRR